MGMYAYTNASSYTIGDTDTKVIAMEFTASEDTFAQFIAQIVIEVAADAVERTATAEGTITIPASSSVSADSSDSTDDSSDGTDDSTDSSDDTDSSADSSTEISVSLPVSWTEDGTAVCYVTYEYNNSYITTIYPAETWHTGLHILTLYYPIDSVTASVACYFNVYIRLEGGSGTVAVGHCIASVVGQSLGGTYAWDGVIEAEDEISRFGLGNALAVRGYTEGMDYESYGEKSYGLSQTVTGRFAIGAFCTPVEEDET